MSTQTFLRNGKFSIEARQADGQDAGDGVLQTHATSALRKFADIGRQTALGAALAGVLFAGYAIGSSAAGPSASAVTSAPAQGSTRISLDISGNRADLVDLAAYALSTMHASSDGVTNLQFNDRPGILGKPGPTARLAQYDGKRVCTISIDGIDEVVHPHFTPELRSDSMDKRMRQFVVAHEAAHCDFMANIEAARSTKDSHRLQPLLKWMDKFEDATANEWDVDVHHVAMTTMLERQADIKAMLVYAKDTIGQAKNPQQMALQIQEFDQFAKMAHSFRTHAEGFEYHLRVHDTSDVIKATRNFVLTSTRNAQQMQSLMDVLKDNASMNNFSQEVAAASMLSSLPQISMRVIAGEMKSSQKSIALADRVLSSLSDTRDPNNQNIQSKADGDPAFSEAARIAASTQFGRLSFELLKGGQASRIQSLSNVSASAAHAMRDRAQALGADAFVQQGLKNLQILNAAGSSLALQIEEVKLEGQRGAHTGLTEKNQASQASRMLHILGAGDAAAPERRVGKSVQMTP